MNSSIHPNQKIILHLGLGSFHRAHQAVYMQALHEKGDTSWILAAGNIRPGMEAIIQALQAQKGAYTLETITPENQHRYQRIESIRNIIAYDPSLSGLIEVGAMPQTRIISFTVTEAGYYLNSENRLDVVNFPDLISDLEGKTNCTIYGALSVILHERMQKNGGGVTLMNCDNLRSNGDRFRAGFIDFLQRRNDHALLAWVQAFITCPNAMVDRITPRPTPEINERVKEATGWNDQSPIMAEAFMQWVIEDHFLNGRPRWEDVGVEMVTSVLPYEEAKIRILNASHSCIAWAGTLIGLHYIHEGASHPIIRQMAYDYVTEEVIPCLHTTDHPCPLDLNQYRDVVLKRFSNAALKDTNQRVAMDGFSKIPGFLWPTFFDRLNAGRSIAKIAKIAALFYAFLDVWRQGKLSYTYQDQSMDFAATRAFFDAPDPLQAFSQDSVLWGPLAGNPVLEFALRQAYTDVRRFVIDNAFPLENTIVHGPSSLPKP